MSDQRMYRAVPAVSERRSGASSRSRDDAGKLLLRVNVAGLLLFHGVDKLLHGVTGVQADLARAGLPGALAYGVYLGEIVAPVLVLLGLWTRPAAIVCAGTVSVGVVIVHAEDFLRLAPTGGWAAELYAFYVAGAIAVALLGAGRFAIRGGRGPWD